MRRMLWMGLGLMGLPLMYGANGGCQMKLPTWGVYDCFVDGPCIDDADYRISDRWTELGFNLRDSPYERSRTCPNPLPLGFIEDYSATWIGVPFPEAWVVDGVANIQGDVWSALWGDASWSTIQPRDITDGHGHHFWAFRWETGYWMPQNANCTQPDINFCYPLSVTMVHDPYRETGVTDYVDIWLVKADGGSCHHVWSGGILPQYDPCIRSVVTPFCLTPFNLVLP